MVSEKLTSVRVALERLNTEGLAMPAKVAPIIGVLRDCEEQVRQMEVNLIAPEPEIEMTVGLEMEPPEAA